MMTGLFHAHSGLRYLLLLGLLVAVVVYGLGYARKQAFAKPHGLIGSLVAGLMHLQVLIGLVMAAMGRFYPALIGHLVLMLVGAVLLQALLIVNRRRATPGFALPLAGVVGALVLVVGGIMSIGRGVFESRAFVVPVG